MQNTKVIKVLLIIIMILIVIACIVAYICFTSDITIIETKREEILFSKNNYPRVDGITATSPLAEAFESNFTGTSMANINIEYSNEEDLYTGLINGNTDLILSKYPSEEQRNLVKENNIEIEIVPIVKEAFVFFVNKENPIENLTLDQIKNIYRGNIINWKDIGGEDCGIIAYQKPEDSYSQSGMIELVMKNTKMMKPTTKTISQNTIDIIDVIPEYNNEKNAIGYAYYYYATTMYTQNTIKLLSIDGIKPTYENIQTGLYNLQIQYYAIIRKDETENSNVRKLLNAMTSERGQNIAKEAGYVQNY